jgi:hypothetical protein
MPLQFVARTVLRFGTYSRKSGLLVDHAHRSVPNYRQSLLRRKSGSWQLPRGHSKGKYPHQCEPCYFTAADTRERHLGRTGHVIEMRLAIEQNPDIRFTRLTPRTW